MATSSLKSSSDSFKCSPRPSQEKQLSSDNRKKIKYFPLNSVKKKTTKKKLLKCFYEHFQEA